MTETPLAAELLQLSLRTLLQKALLHCLSTGWPERLELKERVALSQLQVSEEFQYQYVSAIAHQLAVTRPVPAATLAPQLAAHLTTGFTPSTARQAGVGAIAAGLQAQPTAEGGLVLTLSSAGLAAWLQIWEDSPWLTLCPSPISSPPTIAGNWPLCDRLQLSLPMLLQWGYARCHSWHQIIRGLPAYAPRSSRPALSTSALPPVTQPLLPTVIQAVDQMAARSGASSVCLRQGYRLAAQIYRCDAGVVQGQLMRAERASLAWSEATLIATQAVLACILSNVLGMTPCRHL